MGKGDISQKDFETFARDYPKLDVSPLNMTFGVLFDSCVAALATRRKQILAMGLGEPERGASLTESVNTAEEILWETLRELGHEETHAFRFLFRIKLMEDARRMSGG